jgi:uncharacterized caspase-like protein
MPTSVWLCSLAMPARTPVLCAIHNDVNEVEGALKATGFKVQTVLNANQNQMKRALRAFGNAAQCSDIALLYYSGHGTQANGENYLLLVGAAIEKDSDYAKEAIAANEVLQ